MQYENGTMPNGVVAMRWREMEVLHRMCSHWATPCLMMFLIVLCSERSVGGPGLDCSVIIFAGASIVGVSTI